MTALSAILGPACSVTNLPDLHSNISFNTGPARDRKKRPAWI
jgi:hypothetical protein